MREQSRAYAYAIGAVVLWSTVASAFKITLRYFQPLQLLLYASLTSTVVLFAATVLGGKVRELRRLNTGRIVRAAELGFLNPFLYYLLLFKAYSLLKAQEALTLNFTWPIMLVLLSIPLLRQKVTARSLVAIVISFCGVVVIATRGRIWALEFTNVTAVLLAVGSSVIWALFWIYNVRERQDEVVGLFLKFAFGSVYILLAVLLFSRPVLPSTKYLLGPVYVGLFEMGITFVLWIKALKLAKTTAYIANLIYLVPFLSIVVIHFVVGEPIFPSTIAGLVLIITGILLHNPPRNPRT
jgi:drug/metabolite transporter (DMT)-like permease